MLSTVRLAIWPVEHPRHAILKSPPQTHDRRSRLEPWVTLEQRAAQGAHALDRMRCHAARLSAAVLRQRSLTDQSFVVWHVVGLHESRPDFRRDRSHRFGTRELPRRAESNYLPVELGTAASLAKSGLALACKPFRQLRQLRQLRPQAPWCEGASLTSRASGQVVPSALRTTSTICSSSPCWARVPTRQAPLIPEDFSRPIPEPHRAQGLRLRLGGEEVVPVERVRSQLPQWAVLVEPNVPVRR
jgi:hypothetical protein